MGTESRSHASHHRVVCFAPIGLHTGRWEGSFCLQLQVSRHAPGFTATRSRQHFSLENSFFMALKCATTTVEGRWQHPTLLKLSGPPNPPKAECIVMLSSGFVYVAFVVMLRCGKKLPIAFWFSPPLLRSPVMAKVFFDARSR